MKANELRIGNYVEVFVSFCLIKEEQVIDIMCDSINTKSHENMTFDYIEPIPLTEEWLNRFGFRKSGIYWFDSHDELLSYSFKKNTIAIGRMGIYFENKIHYVHQLQNLYFALTGEELEYDHLK